ncbi:MAG: UpxY family transcription antiterminator [Cytophagales bacterium]|jgi:transcription antitermination factor NusG|nr:UpxY family transcription antiterminator [Cytophagales bacterium]
MNANLSEPNWYVVYTRPKSERKVASSITDMGIESYLPMHKVVRQWSDRKKKIEVPLFSNYVFVKVDDVRRRLLFSIKELLKFVSIEGKPVVIRENEILTIKKVLSGDFDDISTEEYFQEGMKVKITHGLFAGLEGVIIKKCNKTKLIITIKELMKAVSFVIPAEFTEKIDFI